MSTIGQHRPGPDASTPPGPNGRPLLCNGDRMKQPEFHRRYEAYPENVKIELIGGIVYMASPLRRAHGVYHVSLSHVLATYQARTPGVEASDNATAILGEENEPQADLALRILPECGGQSSVDEDEYYTGPPELIAEIAHSTRAIAMNQKREDHERAGVLEYIVLCVEERQLHWFHFPSRRMIRADRQGIACAPASFPAFGSTCPPCWSRSSTHGWPPPSNRGWRLPPTRPSSGGWRGNAGAARD